jgi:hypothetical protein
MIFNDTNLSNKNYRVKTSIFAPAIHSPWIKYTKKLGDTLPIIVSDITLTSILNMSPSATASEAGAFKPRSAAQQRHNHADCDHSASLPPPAASAVNGLNTFEAERAARVAANRKMIKARFGCAKVMFFGAMRYFWARRICSDHLTVSKLKSQDLGVSQAVDALAATKAALIPSEPECRLCAPGRCAPVSPRREEGLIQGGLLLWGCAA